MCRRISWKLLCAYGTLFWFLRLIWQFFRESSVPALIELQFIFENYWNRSNALVTETERSWPHGISSAKNLISQEIDLCTDICTARQIQTDKCTQRKRETEIGQIGCCHRQAIGRNDPVPSVAFGDETWSRISASAKSVWRRSQFPSMISTVTDSIDFVSFFCKRPPDK